MAASSKEEALAPPPRLTVAKRLELLRGALGIYFFFIQYGRLQERIIKFKTASGEKFTQIWFLQVVDALANVIVGAIGRQLGPSPSPVPQPHLAVSGALQVLSKYSFSASLAASLSFHVATLAKSAKMVPVMIGSFLSGQSFSFRQVAQASAIVGGTSLVTLAEGSGKSGTSSKLGLLWVCLALGCDGAVGGVQRRVKMWCKERGIGYEAYNNMFWQNFYMLLTSILVAGFRSEIGKGMSFLRRNPEVMKLVLMFSACGALGQACIFSTIAAFDPVVCTAVTTTRKLASVLLSLYESADTHLPPLGWFGLSLASVGILGEAL